MPYVQAGVAIYSGLTGSSAAKKGAKKQEEAANNALMLEARQAAQSRQDQLPFMNTGVAANKRLGQLLGLDVPSTPEDLGNNAQYKAIYDRLYSETDKNHIAKYGVPMSASKDSQAPQFLQNIKNRAAKEYSDTYGSGGEQDADYGLLTRKFTTEDRDADPVYQSGLQFGMDQGTSAINSRALAGGGYDSGATLKRLAEFGNDYGTTKAEGAYNRFNTDNTNIYNRLAGVSGAGQTATNQVNTIGQNFANSAADLTTQAGNARAAGIVGGSNAWGSALESGVDAYNTANTNSIYDRILKKKGY